MHSTLSLTSFLVFTFCFLRNLVVANGESLLFTINLSPGFSLSLKAGDDPCLKLSRSCPSMENTALSKCVEGHQLKVLQEILRFSTYMPHLDISEGLFMKCEESAPQLSAYHEFSSFHAEMASFLYSIPAGDRELMKEFSLKKTEQKLDVMEDINLFGKALLYHPNSSFVISQLGLSLIKYGRQDLATSLFHNAVQRGIWANVMQRPEWLFDPNLPSKPWHNTSDFPFVGPLEENFRAIRDEVLANFRKKEIEFSEEITNIPTIDNNNWKMLYLKHSDSANYSSYARYFYPNSTAVLRNCGIDFIEVKFSKILPGTHIRPHTGPSNDRLRGHLTLVHSGGASIRVGEEWKTWEEGKVLIFDSSWEHEVYHRGPDPRIVLIFDFWNK